MKRESKGGAATASSSFYGQWLPPVLALVRMQLGRIDRSCLVELEGATTVGHLILCLIIIRVCDGIARGIPPDLAGDTNWD